MGASNDKIEKVNIGLDVLFRKIMFKSGLLLQFIFYHPHKIRLSSSNIATCFHGEMLLGFLTDYRRIQPLMFVPQNCKIVASKMEEDYL